MNFIRKILGSLPDSIFIRLAYLVRQRRIPNFRTPKTLNEKLGYIKLNRTNYQLRCDVVDRLKVRDYVQCEAPSCELIKNLWVGKRFDREVWNGLPQKFVIKANHGSGMVKVVDKSNDSFDGVSSSADAWLVTDYAHRGREWFYAAVEPCLIVEEFLQFKNDVPPDYKFFCINGHVEMVQVDLDRFNGHVRNLYSRDFKLMGASLHYPKGYVIEKPSMYEKALEIAELLAVDFDFIRVDLYLLEERVLFGELTNIPGNGLERFDPFALDVELGAKLRLD